MVQCFHLRVPFPKTFEGKFTHSPNDPNFSQQFACVPWEDAIPSTSKPKQNLPHKEVIRKWAEAAKQFFKEEQDLESSQTSLPCPKTEGLKLSSLEAAAPKHCMKQGPIKSSKKLKVKTKDDDE